MSEFMFSVIKSRISRKDAAKIRKIAKENGAEFVEVNVKENSAPGINNGQYQAWFSGPNYGSPFDQRLATKVGEAIELAGILIA